MKAICLPVKKNSLETALGYNQLPLLSISGCLSSISIIKVAILLCLTFAIFNTTIAQPTINNTDKEVAYTQAINQRAEKIVATLSISDNAKAARVKTIIAAQYRNLNDIQTVRDTKIKTAKAQLSDNKEALNNQLKSFEDAASADVEKLHAKYIASLSKELTPQQVDLVKDGMTYSIVPITYKGYLAMIPTLTDQQKEKIMTSLVEAREHAMDAESSDKKHAWFGKYKGRINNYLSAAGYDLKKEGDDWEKRRKASEAAAAKN